MPAGGSEHPESLPQPLTCGPKFRASATMRAAVLVSVPTQEFYRRRLNESLRFDRDDEVRPAGPIVMALPSEAEVLAVADQADFVREAYRFILGRDPDVAGLNYFCDMVRTQGKSTVLDELKRSDEGQRQRLRWEVVPAAPVSAVESKPTPNRELSDLLAIPEDGSFVARAYLRILARLPDPEGFIHAIRRLHAGERRATFLHGLVTSPEAGPDASSFVLNGQPLRPASSFERLRRAISRRTRSNSPHAVSAAAIAASPAIGAPRPVVPIGEGVVATEIDGFVVGIPAEEWRLVAYHVFRGLLEPGVTRRFCEAVEPGMIVVDVGANIGLYTLYGARLAGVSGRVHSFEPTPRMFSILRDNIQINGLLESGRVVLHPEAVTDKNGQARFAVYACNNGHNTLFPDSREARFIEVPTVTLDEALADEPRIDVIKVDAEGAEPGIWAGMTSILERNRTIRIFIEFAPPHLRRAGYDPADFLNRIGASGFTVERLADETGETVPTPTADLLKVPSTNLLLTRVRA